MRIGLDMQPAQGRKTGIGQYAQRLFEALGKLSPADEYLALDYGRDEVMRLDRRLRWQQWDLPSLAAKRKVDVLHVTGFDAPFRNPCSVVFTVHDLIGMLFPRNLPPVSRFYWTRWLPFSVRFADAIIAVSECTRRDLARLTGVDPARISVVPSGVDEVFSLQPAPVIESCRTRHGLPSEFVLFVGTIEPRKGIDTLIDSFATLSADHPHHLVIAGKRGWYWQPILHRIEQRGVADKVHVLDYVPDDDLPALYAAASVLAFPSHYEGFGFPVLEAMACGTPVICSNASSLPEVAGDAAILLPPGQPAALAEALARVIGDCGLADSLREKGLRQAQKFKWAETARLTREVYQRVALGKNSGRGSPGNRCLGRSAG